MSINTSLIISPGVYLLEGVNPQPVTSITLNACYILGTSATGATNTASLITDLDNFDSTFGASPSREYINQFLSIYSRGLYFINVVSVTPGEPTAAEVSIALASALNENSDLGIIIAPEIFILAGRTDSPAVASEISQAANLRGCIGFIDPPVALKSDVGSDDSSGVRGFSNDIRAATGVVPEFVSLFFPYLTINSVDYAPSAIIAATALSAWSTDISTFPAGINNPLPGEVTLKLDLANRDSLYLNSVNPLIQSKSSGTIVYGVRSLALNRWLINSQVIVNVLKARLTQALEGILFNPITSVGAVFIEARRQTLPVLYSLWVEGGLLGSYPEEAFTVLVDETNNNPVDVKNGLLIVEVSIIPTGAVERVVIPITVV